jgi:hypothetical protein
MTKFKTIALVALTAAMFAGGSGVALAGLGDFAAPMGGGGGGGAWAVKGSSGQIDSPGDAFYPNGAPQSREDACHAAGGEFVIQIEDGRIHRVCIL